MRIEGGRRSGCLDAAEAAATRACVTHEHYGSRSCGLGATAPAIGDVGAAGLLADSMEAEICDHPVDLIKALIRAYFDL